MCFDRLRELLQLAATDNAVLLDITFLSALWLKARYSMTQFHINRELNYANYGQVTSKGKATSKNLEI